MLFSNNHHWKNTFLGLIIPNIVTIFKGDNMRENIGYTALFGAVFF